MQKKLRSGQYKTKNQFAHDLNLIWDNCLVYNASPTHPLRRNATFMRRKANHLLEFLSDKHESKDLLAQWQLSSSTTSNMPRMSSDVASTSADILSTSSTGTFKGSGGNNNNNNNTNNDKVGAHLGGSGMSIVCFTNWMSICPSLKKALNFRICSRRHLPHQQCQLLNRRVWHRRSMCSNRCRLQHLTHSALRSADHQPLRSSAGGRHVHRMLCYVPVRRFCDMSAMSLLHGSWQPSQSV